MASGFIVLDNKIGFAKRSTIYDLVINLIISELEVYEEGEELKTWLRGMAPTCHLDDEYDFGWAFIRESDNALVSRSIDLRCMKEEYRIQFLKVGLIALQKEIKNLENENSILKSVLNDLVKMIESSLTLKYDDCISDMKVDQVTEGEKQGPGWG